MGVRGLDGVPHLVCKVGGALLLLLGFVGFAEPRWLGMHLYAVHNVIHVLSGTAALCVGFAGPQQAARSFSLGFGCAYLLLGLLGFTAPSLVSALLGHAAHANAEALLPDNLTHVAVGALFVAVGLRAPVPGPRWT
jgi:hypothetical protein